MTVQPHPRPGPALPRPPSWRRLTALLWWIEHAFERARAAARPEEDSRVRIFLILAVFGVLFTGLAGRAAWSALAAPAAPAGTGQVERQLTRGDLVDRHGRLLATNVIFYGLYVDPAEVWDRDLAYDALRRALPELDRERLRSALDGKRRVLVAGGLTPARRAAAHALALGGVTFEEEDGRVYPLGPSARHVIGVADGWGAGLTGAELAFDAELRAAGVDGSAVALSIDLRIQGVVESELGAVMAETGAKAGVALVTDVHTGEILAMASWPNDGTRNLATSGHYEMGSVLKTFTVAAGVDAGLADMTTLFDASRALAVSKGRSIEDFHAENRIMTLEEVYLHSSNIGTSQLAIQLGPDRMRDYFKRLGLLDAAPMELKESAAPRRPADWSNSTLASLSFGYAIMITPAQMIAATGALANGGLYVPLSLRKGGAGVEGRRIVASATSLAILDLMRRNVVRGTGGKADAPGLRVGGKTGSANKWTGTEWNTNGVGSFAAVFPADGPLNAPRYAVFVLIDEPAKGSSLGGAVAAPPVGRIVDRIAPILGVERRADRWRTADGRPTPTLADLERDPG